MSGHVGDSALRFWIVADGALTERLLVSLTAGPERKPRLAHPRLAKSSRNDPRSELPRQAISRGRRNVVGRPVGLTVVGGDLGEAAV